MDNRVTYKKNAIPFSALLCMALFAACVLFCALGMSLVAGDASFVVLSLPKGAWYDKAVVLCVADVGVLLLVTLAASRPLCFVASVIVTALRALAFGSAISFCAGNAADSGSVSLLVSFAAVTLLIMAYCVIVSGFTCERVPILLRVLCYLAVSGAAVLLRVLPYFIINF